MPSFFGFALRIYFLLLFSGDGKMVGWNCFLHSGIVEDADNNYGISILISSMIWRLLFSDADIKMEIVSSPPWNK